MLDIQSIAHKVHQAVQDYPVKKVELFGSYAQRKQTEASDVDLLVEFNSLAVSLLTISALRNRLEDELGLNVDLVHAPLPADSFLDIGETVTLYER